MTIVHRGEAKLCNTCDMELYGYGKIYQNKLCKIKLENNSGPFLKTYTRIKHMQILCLVQKNSTPCKRDNLTRTLVSPKVFGMS